jgi:hypothetical protein
MIILAMFGLFYLIPMLILWLALRNAYHKEVMTRDDAEGLFPFTLMPIINFIVTIYIFKEAVSDIKFYSKIMNVILGEKK